ncbi:MAG: hypothetical protein ABIR60_10580 [Allosphingosinicella sp.]
MLRRLAEDGALGGVEPFSGAEVLDPIDREIIERASGRRVREIYMATEGLFGVACRHGTLHLAEDVVRFEWEEVPGSDLVVPIVTDMVRRVQPMIRYRMNDLLQLSDSQCPCGSPCRAVERIHGRMDRAPPKRCRRRRSEPAASLSWPFRDRVVESRKEGQAGRVHVEGGDARFAEPEAALDQWRRPWDRLLHHSASAVRASI